MSSAVGTGVGSSPLARGLPQVHRLEELVGGIIPARAGFTEGPPAAVPARRDHPRSRGVYRPQRQALHQRGGSSPLARGLHPAGPGLLGAGGIIPARAGFTPCCGPTPTRSWDHPRSRGVYTGARVPVCPPTGSSPLARGLRERPWEPRGRPRIIPARAGFTRARRRGSCRRRDHPRSRGVYRYRTHAYKEAYGSSPLARGLPTTDTPSLGERGIIPARAGFTCNTQTMSLPPHGSSPLARGLPSMAGVLRMGRRIIPARAGFTAQLVGTFFSSRDHPRSRGVYACRILGVCVGDHPRSRGVYTMVVSTLRARAGSSPLARGLHLTSFF